MVFRGTKGKDRHYTLSDIIRGLIHSVNTSQEILEQHYSRMLSRYFSKDGEPITTKIMVDPERYMEVPLITLISPSALALKEMDLEMSLHVDEIILKKVEDDDYEKEITRGSFIVSVDAAGITSEKPSDIINVCMKFRAIDPPEGVSRLFDEFNKQI